MNQRCQQVRQQVEQRRSVKQEATTMQNSAVQNSARLGSDDGADFVLWGVLSNALAARLNVRSEEGSEGVEVVARRRMAAACGQEEIGDEDEPAAEGSYEVDRRCGWEVTSSARGRRCSSLVCERTPLQQRGRRRRGEDARRETLSPRGRRVLVRPAAKGMGAGCFRGRRPKVGLRVLCSVPWKEKEDEAACFGGWRKAALQWRKALEEEDSTCGEEERREAGG